MLEQKMKETIVLIVKACQMVMPEFTSQVLIHFKKKSLFLVDEYDTRLHFDSKIAQYFAWCWTLPNKELLFSAKKKLVFSFHILRNINDFRSIPAQCRTRQGAGRFLIQSSSFHLKKKYLFHFNKLVEDKRFPFDPKTMQNKISRITWTQWDHSGIALGLLRNIFGVAVGGTIS